MPMGTPTGVYAIEQSIFKFRNLRSPGSAGHGDHDQPYRPRWTTRSEASRASSVLLLPTDGNLPYANALADGRRFSKRTSSVLQLVTHRCYLRVTVSAALYRYVNRRRRYARISQWGDRHRHPSGWAATKADL